MITLQELKDNLKYDPDTGNFCWIKRKNGRVFNSVPGNTLPNGYKRIGIDGTNYLCHRLAWLYMTGEMPNKVIDHIDGDPSNNKFNNLREVEQATNVQNIKKATKANKSSGLLGVSYHARDNLWRARIMINRKDKCIGYFKSKATGQPLLSGALKVTAIGAAAAAAAFVVAKAFSV